MARLRLLLRAAHACSGWSRSDWAWPLVTCASAARRRVTPLRQRRPAGGWRALCAALPFEVRVSGEAPRQPMLWVANHVS